MAKARVKVTPEMMAQALAETDWARVDATTDTDIARQIAADPDTAPEMTDADFDRAGFAARVRAIRASVHQTQRQFSERFGIPLTTLRDWEQARSRPDAPALAYLKVIEAAPEVVARVLGSDYSAA